MTLGVVVYGMTSTMFNGPIVGYMTFWLGGTAVTLAQTMRATAKEAAANPRDTATDAFSNLSYVQARYRGFRRGIRVGAQTARFQKK
mgnify:CR=1 FL=1